MSKDLDKLAYQVETASERQAALTQINTDIQDYNANRLYAETVFNNRMLHGAAQADTMFTTPVLRIYESPFTQAVNKINES